MYVKGIDKIKRYLENQLICLHLDSHLHKIRKNQKNILGVCVLSLIPAATSFYDRITEKISTPIFYFYFPLITISVTLFVIIILYHIFHEKCMMEYSINDFIINIPLNINNYFL